MSLKEKLIEASTELPARFEEQKDGTLKLKFKVAESVSFQEDLDVQGAVASRDENRTAKFFETLKETGAGISSGDSDISPGFGYKMETYKTTGKEREESIEERSRLFGKDYKYSFDYSMVRKKVEQEAKMQDTRSQYS